MTWLRNNISFALQIFAVVAIVGGYLGDIIPKPASAANLDKLADSVQQLHDIQKTSTKNHSIDHLQAEIDAIKLQFMIAGKPLNDQAVFYIQQRETKIQNIKDRE